MCVCAPLLLAGSGCKRSEYVSPAAAVAAARQNTRQMDADRQQMELVPPPSKNLYLAVRSLSEWNNPFLTIQDDLLTLHILQPDPISASMGQGTLLRPTSARRRDLTIRLSDLPDALTSLPENNWPYGRVIAIEEQHGISAANRPVMRRNLEATVKMLTDLGIVVDEWNDNGSSNTMR